MFDWCPPSIKYYISRVCIRIVCTKAQKRLGLHAWKTLACQLQAVTSKTLRDRFTTRSLGTAPRSLRSDLADCTRRSVACAIREVRPLFNESRSHTTMAEVLPQIRVRADTQSREASSKVATPAILPLRDATNNTGNGRVIAPESVEGEIPSQLAGFGNMAQPTTTNIFAEPLTPLLQHDSYQIPKAIQASSCKPFLAIRRMLRASLPGQRNGEIRKQLTLYHTYVSECLGIARGLC